MSEARTELGPLRAALEAANRRAAQAEGTSQELRTRLQSETTSRIANQEAALDRLISQSEETSSALEREWARHQADGKFEEAAAAMRRMTENSALVGRYREQKQELQQIRSAPAPAQQTNDPMASYSPAVRAWIGANPQFLADDEFKEKAMRGHHAALAAGVKADTREYFEHVERQTYPERFAEAKAPDPPPPPDPSNPANQEAAPAAFPTGLTPENPLSQPAEQEVDVVVDHTPADRATRSVPIQTATRQDIDIPPSANGDIVIEQAPQVRPVGRGGPGIASVAAPPSRNIAAAAARATGGGPISISPQEMEVALSLAEDIEPAVAQRGQIEVAKWYAALYGSPAVQRKIAKWDAR